MNRPGVFAFFFAATVFLSAARSEDFYSNERGSINSSNSGMGILTHEMSDGRIRNSSSPIAKERYTLTMDALYSVMGPMPDVQYTTSGNAIIVQGATSDPFFKVKLWRLNQSFNNIVDLTVLSPEGEAKFASLKSQWKSLMLNTLNAGFSPEKAHIMAQSIDVSVEGGHLVVNGEVNNPDDLVTLKRLADMYDNYPIINAMVRNQMIELDVIFLAVSGNSGMNVGVRGLQNFTVRMPSFGVGGAYGPYNPTAYSGYSNAERDYRYNPGGRDWDIRVSNENNALSVALQINEEDLSILARPHLATLNGRKAYFHSGGTITMRVPYTYSSNPNSSSGNYTDGGPEEIDYGTKLTCTPRLTSDGLIDILVNLEFKIPTQTKHIADSVDFVQHQYTGRAVLAKDQAIVLTGMMKQLRQYGVDRTPGISKLPIIGQIFSGRKRGAENEELVVLIRPRIPVTVDFDCADPFRDGVQAADRSRDILNELVYEQRDEETTSPSIRDNGLPPVQQPFWRRK